MAMRVVWTIAENDGHIRQVFSPLLVTCLCPEWLLFCYHQVGSVWNIPLSTPNRNVRFTQFSPCYKVAHRPLWADLFDRIRTDLRFSRDDPVLVCAPYRAVLSLYPLAHWPSCYLHRCLT